MSGSLRDQVTYPTLAGFQRRFDARVAECLHAAGLTKLAENPLGLELAHEEWCAHVTIMLGMLAYRAHAGRPVRAHAAPDACRPCVLSHWCHRDDVLSGGERQRIGFARALFFFTDARRPRYAILDEATSASACGRQR